MERVGDSYKPGTKLDLPKGTTCFNFNWLPAGRESRT